MSGLSDFQDQEAKILIAKREKELRSHKEQEEKKAKEQLDNFEKACNELLLATNRLNSAHCDMVSAILQVIKTYR